jgi:predicted nucleic acid-binding protein
MLTDRQAPDAPASTQIHPEIALRSAMVLDTNVVLDWLIFRNPTCKALDNGLQRGSLRWLASAAMRGELAHVLSRGVVDRWTTDHAWLWAQWRLYAVELPDSPLAAAAGRLRCTDTDDQKFIDFALMHRTRWLLTRDRAVLKLGKRARALELVIVTPEDWSASV